MFCQKPSLTELKEQLIPKRQTAFDFQFISLCSNKSKYNSYFFLLLEVTVRIGSYITEYITEKNTSKIWQRIQIKAADTDLEWRCLSPQ